MGSVGGLGPNVCPSISAEDNRPLTPFHVHGSRKGQREGTGGVRIRRLIWEGSFQVPRSERPALGRADRMR